MSEQIIVVEGETVEQAIKKGLKRLGKGRDDVVIKILQREQPGLFGKIAEPARVRLTSEGADLKVEIEQTLKNLLELLDLGDYRLKIEICEDHYLVLIDPEENYNRLIGPEGRTLNALQALVQQRLNDLAQEPVKVLLDSRYFRNKRKKDLVKKTRYFADRIVSSQKKIEFEPMSPEERKVVHQTAKGIDGIISNDIGEGECRRVELRPHGKS